MPLHLSVLVAMISILLSSCSKQESLEQIAGFAQGTDYNITWWSQDKINNSAVKQAVDSMLKQIDEELSTYRPDSYISQFNNSPSTEWQTASQDFIDLINIAKKINADTQGCYDPTIGPLFDLWGFHNDNFKKPTEQQIQSVQAKMGIDKIEIDASALKIRKTQPELALNFSSMGEGYSIYKLSHVLEQQGINDYLIAFGGDMKIKGHKPENKQWRIAIQNPKTAQATVYKIIAINDPDHKGITLDTSGTYRQYYDENGQRYSHILDSRTGSPVTHNLISASVFGSDPRVSDAWATAMLCLGKDQGEKIAEQLGLNVFFIQHDEDKLIDTKSTTLQKNASLIFDM
jgi:thiamine biosynthesis lipoprotein